LTIRDDEFIDRWKAFQMAGCTYESVNEKYISIDIPANSDVVVLYTLLEDGETAGVWVFEEGYFAGSPG
jgi:hypothetical protein